MRLAHAFKQLAAVVESNVRNENEIWPGHSGRSRFIPPRGNPKRRTLNAGYLGGVDSVITLPIEQLAS
jgi:hypothetical protein